MSEVDSTSNLGAVDGKLPGFPDATQTGENDRHEDTHSKKSIPSQLLTMICRKAGEVPHECLDASGAVVVKTPFQRVEFNGQHESLRYSSSVPALLLSPRWWRQPARSSGESYLRLPI